MNSSNSDNIQHSLACNSADAAFEYLILPEPGESEQEGLFPMHEVSIIAGPSGAGKTTWALQFLHAWQKGEKFFRRPSCPKPFTYLSFDRSGNGLRRTLKRLGIPLRDIRHWFP